ncbi:MAG: hypothetical protein HY059_06255 [Proteobacteria bacterium]|nr:hypothetical protein [Pseudomonadota bacterium]
MGRSIVAVIVGFVLIAGLSIGTDVMCQRLFPGVFRPQGGSDNTLFLIGSLAYVGVYATFGSWVTARLAPDRPMRHALILGGLGQFFTIMGTIGGWASAPAWYHVIGVLTVMPYAWLGGRLRERQLLGA